MHFAGRSVFVTLLASLLCATSAQAIISVDYTNDTGGATLGVGAVFHVDVFASWDGTPTLSGMFTSTRWDPTRIQLTGATDSPTQIFSGPDGGLGRLANPFQQPGDVAGTLRTIQHGVFPTETASRGGPSLITRLTFTVLGVGNGIAEISGFVDRGDGIFDGSFNDISPSSYSLGTTSVSIVPEPGTALLMGFGFALLADRRRRAGRGERG